MRPRHAAARKNQRHHLHAHVIGARRGQLANRLPMGRPLLSMVASSSAVPEHHDHQCGETGDIDGAIAVRRSDGSDLARIGHGLGERHTYRMPGRAPLRMSKTTCFALAVGFSPPVDSQKITEIAKPGSDTTVKCCSWAEPC
jgi:hypothetical protein